MILAAGSSDTTISIISLIGENTAWEVKQFEGHKGGGITSISWGPSTDPTTIEGGDLALSPALLRFVSGSCDKNVRYWTYNLTEKDFNYVIIASHEDWVRDVAFAPNIGLPCETIASCSEDGSVIITKKLKEGWVQTKLPKFRVPAWKLSWSLTGSYLAVACGDNVVYIFEEKSKEKWEIVSVSKDKSQLQKN